MSVNDASLRTPGTGAQSTCRQQIRFVSGIITVTDLCADPFAIATKRGPAPLRPLARPCPPGVHPKVPVPW